MANNTATSSPVTVTVSNAPLPALSISDVVAGTTNAVFAVTLSTTSTQTVTVVYATANGTGTAGIDYVATAGNLSFAPGTTTQTITVQVINATRLADRTFFVNLRTPTGATIAKAQGTGTIVANTYTLSVAKAGTGSGTVTSSPGGINCGATCSANYPAATLVTLIASPGAGSLFTGWSACPGTGTCQVAMSAAQSVTATFTLSTTPPTVSLTAPLTGQTVSGTITVSANASDVVGVAGVQFKLDGANLGAEVTSSPYSISWATTAAPNGPHTLTAVARNTANNTATSSPVTVTVSNATTPLVQFYTVTPCRLADTRNAPAPSGGPSLVAGASRTFPVTGLCGIPTGAQAIAINVTVVNETQLGDLRLYPAGGAVPLASSINFAANKVRANNQIIALGAGGQISVQCDLASTGSTHFLFDVSGYFK
jgi:hypothetical protein